MRLRALLRRIRAKGLAGSWRALRPETVDQLLYTLAPDRSVPAPQFDPGLVLTRHSVETPSGIAAIDRRLTPDRVCYLVREGTELVHQNWLCADVLMPQSFGFDGTTPVAGYGETVPRHRGRHIQPRVLQHMAHDVASGGTSSQMYTLVSPSNASSIKGIERAGGRLLARLTGTRFLGLVWRRKVHPPPTGRDSSDRQETNRTATWA